MFGNIREPFSGNLLRRRERTARSLYMQTQNSRKALPRFHTAAQDKSASKGNECIPFSSSLFLSAFLPSSTAPHLRHHKTLTCVLPPAKRVSMRTSYTNNHLRAVSPLEWQRFSSEHAGLLNEHVNFYEDPGEC